MTLVWLTALLSSNLAHATPLGELAASMEPGTFAELTFPDGHVYEALRVCESTSNIGEYADSGSWDPVTHEALFLGNSHGTCYGSKFVIYSEDAHAFRTGPLPAEGCLDAEGLGCVAHSYSHNTIDPETGTVYYRFYGSRNVWQYDTRGTRAWSLHSVMGTRRDVTGCCGGLEFFPVAGRRGLLFVDGSEGVYFWSEASDEWSLIANTGLAWDDSLPTLAMGDIENFAEYNPVARLMLFGGGDGPASLYTLDAAGMITAEPRAPDGLTTRSTEGWVTVDPVSGRYLVFQMDGSFYDYDAVSDTWTRQEGEHPLNPLGHFEGFEVPITSHGVNLFVVFQFEGSSVWLYKHRPSEPPPPRDGGIVGVDGGETDGGSTAPDGGARASDGGARADAGAASTPDDGCACDASGSGSGAAILLLLLVPVLRSARRLRSQR
jgi:hypothetical protein